MNKVYYRYIALCLFCIMQYGVAYTQAPNKELEDSYYGLIGRADKAIEHGDWAGAEEYLLTALSNEPQHPTNVMVMSNLGLVQYNLGRDSLALETLSRAHAIAPRSVTILANRAQVLEAMGRDSLAFADYSKVLALDSSVVEPLYAHAMIALRLGYTDKAVADCNRLQEVAADSVQTHRAWANVYSVKKQWLDAIPHFTALIDAVPTAADYCGRAVCYLMLNRLNEASADISTGLELDPENRELYFYRAYLNKARYRHDDAREDMRRALSVKKQPDIPF